MVYPGFFMPMVKDSIPNNAQVAIEALKRGGYIKGYGDKGRVMDSTHHPLFNIQKSDLEWLKTKGAIRQENNVYILSELYI